ncbi:protein translocase subunit SecDF [Mycoplasma sp. ES3225-GEN-MYC]|uniref:protein translocase subunit SecDF n=1 Tax=Mycoplasma miroungigenitalium TaxID=754515 RepID=UPI001C10C3C6|nr:protein translocase subunit SecDF [Mycoplasma miroungigenitalium]MBU4691498.1 protein translocase subunit SecDF [Mycoplasma miroungigenitalium]
MKKIVEFFKGIFKSSAWKKFFTLSGWKRWFLSFFIVTAAVTTVVTGSVLYTSKNVNKSIEYGGGQEFLVQIENNDSKTPTKSIAKSLQNRIGGGVEFGAAVTEEGRDKIKLSKNGDLSANDRKTLENVITTKSTMIFTDIDGQPLFRNNVFVKPNENNKIDWNKEFDNADLLKTFVPPIKSAKSTFTGQNNYFGVEVQLASKAAEIEWTKATEYLAKKGQGKNYLLTWLNLGDLIRKAKKDYSAEWDKAMNNPYNFVYVGENPEGSILKSNSINAESYLINKIGVNRSLNGDSFVIPSNASGQPLQQSSAQKLAEEINFGTAKYELKVISSNYINLDSGSDHNIFNSGYEISLIAIGLCFILIAIILMINYGLLGALSTISMALYIFITMSLFSVLRGEYSPVALGSIIVGMGICFDMSVITYSRLKQEIYKGEKMRKAVGTTRRATLQPISDSLILTLLISFMAFYFGSQTVRTFGISLVFSIIGVLIATLLITRLAALLLVNSKVFINKPQLLGVRPNKMSIKKENKLANFNYLKNSKWFIIAAFAFIFISMVVYATFAGINKDVAAGFSRSFDFHGGTNITIQAAPDSSINKAIADQISSHLQTNASQFGIENINNVLKINSLNSDNTSFKLVIQTTQFFDNIQLKNISDSLHKTFTGIDVMSYGVNANQSLSLISTTSYALLAAWIIISVYVLIRYKWTYAIAISASIIFEILLTLSFVALARIQLNVLAITAFIAIMVISVKDKLLLAAKAKELHGLNYHTDFIEKEDVESIAKEAINANMKRSMYSMFTIMAICIIMLIFFNSINPSFTLILLFGSVASIYTSIFITMKIWSKLEIKRQTGIKKRYKNKYWVLPGHDEQIFPGINDFIA